jgi:redox-sensitive bicupin YhaK (pirin superfamily)
VGSLIKAPEQAKGVTWHPHRAVKTVSYVLDSEIAHHDTNGGVLQEGDTQWMMAGAGILHDELPTNEDVPQSWRGARGPAMGHNLPRSLKMTPPRCQSITQTSFDYSPPTTERR